MVHTILSMSKVLAVLAMVASLVLCVAVLAVLAAGRSRPGLRAGLAMLGLGGAVVLPASILSVPLLEGLAAAAGEGVAGLVAGTLAREGLPVLAAGPVAAMALVTVATWLAGLVVLLVRERQRHRRELDLAWRAVPAAPELEALSRSARARLGINEPVEVRVSGELTQPMALTGARPMVVVPADLSGPELSHALMTALVQAGRGDHGQLSMSRAARALWWFNPLATWLERQAERDRLASARLVATATAPARAWWERLQEAWTELVGAAKPSALARASVVAALSAGCLVAAAQSVAGPSGEHGVSALTHHVKLLERRVADVVEPASTIIRSRLNVSPPGRCGGRTGCRRC